MRNRMDMINGSLGDKIIRYALPLALTGILQQLFNAADLAVVGQFSGKAAMAAVVSSVIMLFAHQLLGIFNTDPEVIATGIIRLKYIFFAYLFSFAQEVLSGYLRGFGVSFIPAACAVVGICGVRLTWIFTIFRQSPSFVTIMQVYPLSLGVTAAVILVVTLFVKPSRRYAAPSGQ